MGGREGARVSGWGAGWRRAKRGGVCEHEAKCGGSQLTCSPPSTTRSIKRLVPCSTGPGPGAVVPAYSGAAYSACDTMVVSVASNGSCPSCSSSTAGSTTAVSVSGPSTAGGTAEWATRLKVGVREAEREAERAVARGLRAWPRVAYGLWLKAFECARRPISIALWLAQSERMALGMVVVVGAKQ